MDWCLAHPYRASCPRSGSVSASVLTPQELSGPHILLCRREVNVDICSYEVVQSATKGLSTLQRLASTFTTSHDRG